MAFIDFVDRLAIIHLPDRVDRLKALTFELAAVGIDIQSPKVLVTTPPTPSSAHGFPSCAVYSNYLSHLSIIEDAYSSGLDTLWILEDDAIFSQQFRHQQHAIASLLQENDWDLCFIGHSVWRDLPTSPTGLLRFSGPFVWAHSYVVHRRVMTRLIEYLRTSMNRPVGHPEGGKNHLDGALFFFRQINPDLICLVSSPCLSVQKGSVSSITPGAGWKQAAGIRSVMQLARQSRDELWRRGWIRVDGPQDLLDKNFKLTSTAPKVWPGS
jgi:glycosyl transferase family 25